MPNQKGDLRTYISYLSEQEKEKEKKKKKTSYLLMVAEQDKDFL